MSEAVGNALYEVSTCLFSGCASRDVGRLIGACGLSEAIRFGSPSVVLRELSPNFGDGLTDQAAAVWDFEGADLATTIPSVNLTP
jgi:hypothetical protein